MPQKTVQPQLRAPRSRVGARAAAARWSLPTRTQRLAKVSGLAPFGPRHPPRTTQAAPVALRDPS